MTVIFNGKKFAEEKLKLLSHEVKKLENKGIIPKLVSVLVGDDPASRLYTNLKKKAADKIGCELSVINYPLSVNFDEIKRKIKDLNLDPKIHGIMIQLPLPDNLKPKTQDLINVINPKKDVDGLQEYSLYVTPTALAVLEIIKQSGLNLKENNLKLVVVGAKGFEGRKIVKALEKTGYRVQEVDKETDNLKHVTENADILISTTGVPDLIKKDMVKNGAVLIDIGAPKGDIDKSAYEKASFVSPVPGGVGPVAISFLIENLVLLVEKIA